MPERPPRDALGALLERAVAEHLDDVAVVDGDVSVSYRQLRAIAEDIGQRCRALTGPGEGVVALDVERSWRLVGAAFAVVAAGLGFTVLSPELPQARRNAMLDALGSVPVLRWPAGGAPSIDAERVERAAAPSGGDAERAIAYVIFTSGSTGTPKAAANERRGLAGLVRWHVATYGDRGGWVAAQIASSLFDVFVWDVFGTLGGGGTLRLVPDTDYDPYTLWRHLADVDVAQVPTPLAHVLFADEAMQPASMRLRHLLTGGDRLLLRPEHPRSYRCTDHYGPSECSVLATSTAALGDIAQVPQRIVGTAIPGQRIVVVDDALRPVGDGELGEVLIAGDCVGRGYLNDPVKTAASFFDGLPYLPAGTRAYRTGDLGRIVGGGALEFHGREDAQVKVRGYRVELGDVEAAVAACPGVVDAVAGLVEIDGAARLAVVALAAAAVDERSVLAFVAGVLPRYMVPERIRVVTAVPRTASGKLDRHRALAMIP